MRTAVLAVLIKDNPEAIATYIKANTLLTHSDERAYETSLVLARLVQKNLHNGPFTVRDLQEASKDIQNEELRSAIATLTLSFQEQISLSDYLQNVGLDKGVTGYCIHTFLAAVYANLCFGKDIETIIQRSIQAGGDTDSVAAVAAALSAANTECQLPKHLLDGIYDKPFSVSFMKKLCNKEADLRYFAPKMLLRNLFFVPFLLLLAVVRTFR